MKSQERAKGLCLILTLALASAALAVATFTATAIISPTEVDSGDTITFTFTLTNTGTQQLGYARVQIPSGFTVDSATVTSFPTNKPWQADLGATTIDLHPVAGGEGTKKLATGQAIVVTLSATAPTVSEDTEYEWTTSAWSGTDPSVSPNVTISSQPTVLVQAPTVIAANIDIDPDALNLDSEGQVVTCYITLPADYDVADIDVESILLNGEIAVAVKNESFWSGLQDRDLDGIDETLMVKFDRVVLQDLVEDTLEVGDEVELTVTGTVGGVPFAGSDTITVIDH